jgi:hypothetical protein
MVYDRGENGVIFRVTEDGKVLFKDYILSTSFEMQNKIQPLIERVVPAVAKYFEDLLRSEMEKERR